MSAIVEKARTGMMQGQDNVMPSDKAGQYTLRQILGIWFTGGLPMWILGWLAYPLLSQNLSAADAGLLRVGLLTVGLVWQFVLSMIILYREEGNLRLSTIRRRFWLNNPVSGKTGRKNNRLWLLLIPFLLLTAVIQVGVSPILTDLLTKFLPFLAEPPGYGPGVMFAPALRPHWVGAWGLLALFVVFGVFNTFGEEFLFRGVLLPKMGGVFGRWDWLANGVIFGLYHLHQPWGIPDAMLAGLVFAFTGRQFRSNWFPIILHSIQSVFFLVLILGLVLGLA